jgi:3-hydroxyisobutyrate dehydrogenase
VAATTGADVVITMLPSGGHVLDAYRPGAGIIGTVGPDTLLIDCSTIDVADARAAHDHAAAAGLPAVDAPVSGGVVGATAASLTFMVGGAADAVARAQPLLAAMGKRVVHCGDPGAGQAAKVCNNMILAASMIAVGEAFVLAESLGLDHQALFDVVSTSSGQCWAVSANCPVPGPVPTSPANRGFAGGFATKLMAKDLRLAAAAAEQGDVDIALGRHALAIYEELAAELPDRDFSVVIDAVRRRSGNAERTTT